MLAASHAQPVGRSGPPPALPAPRPADPPGPRTHHPRPLGAPQVKQLEARNKQFEVNGKLLEKELERARKQNQQLQVWGAPSPPPSWGWWLPGERRAPPAAPLIPGPTQQAACTHPLTHPP